MELFTLFAKLTLDTKEYDKQVASIEKKTLSDLDIGVSLDKDQLETDVANIANIDVPDIKDEAGVGIDQGSLDTEIAGVANEDVPDITDEAGVDIDQGDLDTQIANVANEDVPDVTDQPKITLDTQDFKDGISESVGEANSFSETVGESFAAVKSALVATGIVAVLTQITGLFKQAINQTVETADAIDKGSIRMGITTKEYQAWNHALSQSGGSISDLNRGLMNFRAISASANDLTDEEIALLKELGIDYEHAQTRAELYAEAKEKLAGTETLEGHEDELKALNSLAGDNVKLTNDQINAFRMLGISIQKENGEMKTSDELLMESLDALAAMDDIGARDNIVDKLFGRNSGGIKPLLDAGVDGMHDLLNEAEKLGLVMSDDEIKNAVAYGDAVANLKAEFQAIQSAFVQDVIPALTDSVKMVTEILAFFNPRVKGNTLSKQFEGIDKEFAKDLVEIEGTAGAAEDLVDKLLAMGSAEKLTAEQQAEWRQTAEWLIENIPGLSEAIDLDTQSITKNKDEIYGTIEAWKKYSIERAVASAKEKKYQAMLEKNADAIDKQAQARAKGIETTQKYNTIIAEANRLMDEYPQLKEYVAKYYGVDSLNKDTENLDAILSDIGRLNAFQLKTKSFDNKEFNELVSEYHDLQAEQNKLNKEYESYKDDLTKAEKEYELWEQAVNEMYGITEEGKLDDELSKTGDTAKETAKDIYKISDALIESIEQAKTMNKELAKLLGGNTYTQYTRAHQHSAGAWDVPYDEYPAVLHRNEMVLNASRARQYREGGSDIDYARLENAMIAAVQKGMNNAQVNAYINGKDITDTVSRELANQMQGRRYG